MNGGYRVPRIEGIAPWARAAVSDLYEQAYLQRWEALVVSERELAARWQVSRWRVSSLLGLLESMGHVRRVRGVGTAKSVCLVYEPGDTSRKRIGSKLTIGKGQPLDGGPRGLDVALHYVDIRKIVVGRFGDQARGAGVDPEDLVVTVVQRIMTANRGGAMYDPSRGSVSNYIYQHARSALLNEAKRVARRREREVLGEEADAALEEWE